MIKRFISLFLLVTSQLAWSQGSVDWNYTHRDPQSSVGSKNFDNEIVYQIVVDRFHNGNTANDCVFDKSFCSQGWGDPWYRYQGGDIRGIIEKLDYLKNLGVTRLWLTPIFENQTVTAFEQRFNGEAEVSSYHGYWIKDWFRLNPYFTDRGTEDYDIVGELIAAAKARGIGIYLDTVANHSSPIRPSDWSLDLSNRLQPLSGTQSHVGAIFENGDYFASYGEDRYFSHTYPNHIKKFHQFEKNIGQVNGSSDWDSPYILENYNLVGLADFDQNNGDMYRYLKDAHDFWMARFPDLAGYRMDTIKHVNQGYWQTFSNHIYDRFPQIEILGEYYSGGGSNDLSLDFYKNTKMSMLDFDSRKALTSIFLHNGSFRRLTDVWSNDKKLGNALAMITYFDSHDHPRLRGQGLTAAMLKIALPVWLLSRGVPVIYYGLEQDLFVEGDPGDPYNRPMQTQFDESRATFHLMQKLNRIRRENPAVRWGKTHVVHVSDHLFVFERELGDKQLLLAVSKKPGSEQQVLQLKGLHLKDDQYRDRLTGRAYKVENHEMTLRLGFGEMVLLER